MNIDTSEAPTSIHIYIYIHIKKIIHHEYTQTKNIYIYTHIRVHIIISVYIICHLWSPSDGAMNTSGFIVLRSHGHVLVCILWVRLSPTQLLHLDKKHNPRDQQTHRWCRVPWKARLISTDNKDKCGLLGCRRHDMKWTM